MRHLLEVIHPTQRERFEVDARGWRTARLVTLNTPQGELTAVTRYEHDERGQRIASTLHEGVFSGPLHFHALPFLLVP